MRLRGLSRLKTPVNHILHKAGLELIRVPLRDQKHYIPFEETLRAAEQAGLSVADYIEARHDRPGSSQETIDEMAKLGVFAHRISTVCEVGPGSGRYLEKTIRLAKPDHYEIYDTAVDWRNWLVQKYGVVLRNTDSVTLLDTASQAMDLVQAHKVFSTIQLFEVLHYFSEFRRVSRHGGKLVFDVITEDCVSHQALERWLSARHGWPNTFMPRQFVVRYFSDHGFTLDGSFFVSMQPFVTECFVFTNTGRQD